MNDRGGTLWLKDVAHAMATRELGARYRSIRRMNDGMGGMWRVEAELPFPGRLRYYTDPIDVC